MRVSDRPRAAAVAQAAPELRMGKAAVAFLAVLTLPLAAGGQLLVGPPAAVGAVAGAGLVAILFGVAGLIQSAAARRGPAFLGVATWIGIGIRLALYAIVLGLLGRLDWLHRPSVAIACGIAFTATLGYEMWFVGRNPGLYWVRVARSDAGGADA